MEHSDILEHILKNKIIKAGLFCLAILLILLSCEQNIQDNTDGIVYELYHENILLSENELINFERCSINQNKKKHIQIKNLTERALTIDNISIENNTNFSINLSNHKIIKNGLITILFNPTNSGEIKSNLTIVTKDKKFVISVIGSGVDYDIPQIPNPGPYMKYINLNNEINILTENSTDKIYIKTEVDNWQQLNEKKIVFEKEGKIKYQIKLLNEDIESNIAFFELTVTKRFPSFYSDNPEFIHKDDAIINGWATGFVTPVKYGLDLIDIWKKPDNSIGKVEGNSYDVCSLGNGGEIILVFDKKIFDGVGPDFAVFENGFSPEFLELGFVEVSSNGVDFVRFDSISLTEAPVHSYGQLDSSKIYGLTGTYPAGYGTPFDLEYLRFKKEVTDGLVDLYNINYIKIIDISGNKEGEVYHYDYDSFGNIIYDPFKTTESAGFDLDGVGIINCIY